jgi:hypothetical protein
MNTRLLLDLGCFLVSLPLALVSCERQADHAAPAPTTSAPVRFPDEGDATVHRIDSTDEVHLKGPRVDARKGDWLLQGHGVVAVVSAARGSVVDFAAAGSEDALVSIDPALFLGLEQAPSVVQSVTLVETGKAVLVQRKVLSDPPLTLWSYITLSGTTLRLESLATAQTLPALAVTLGEVVAWGNVPTWVEGHGFATAAGTWGGSFIGREGLGTAYALSVEGKGNVLGRFGASPHGFFEAARTGEVVEGVPANGASERRVVVVSVASGLTGNAAMQLPALRAGSQRWALPQTLAPRAFVEVESCDGLPFAHFVAGPDIELPPGCWHARIAQAGYAPGPWGDPSLLGDAGNSGRLPRAGTLRWKVREKGAVVPARIVLRGVGNPDPDWGTDPVNGASLNVIHADRDGVLSIPPGRYRATVTRGIEYTEDTQELAVEEGHEAVITSELARVVDTAGWISADLHVHAVSSPDAPSPLPDRVAALAAAGVEVAVATDHNAVTDYGPTIRDRGLSDLLASVVGDEVTTRGVPMGHFNVFPLAAGSEPVAFDHIAPKDLLASARDASSLRIVQMNHPRMAGIGYLDLLRFDPRDVTGWRSRSPLGELGFDAIEVFNGDHYAEIDEVERVLVDWYALLNAGVRMTATGNSDSHRITFHEAGVPRNFVQVTDDSPAHFDENGFVEAVRAGRVVVSSGPFVRLDVSNHGVGEEAPPGNVEVHVRVDAPDWVDVSKVDVIVRGKSVHTWNVAPSGAVRRFDAKFTTALKAGDWVVTVVRGERPMEYLARAGAKPFAFTNPVWIK